ncbi:MAG: glyoxalase [Frankiales bacterium]|nr:glyoxalase [Frankiales bacterium]
MLGWVELDRDGPGCIEIGDPCGAQPTLVLSASGEPRRGKLPLHLDVNATDRGQDDELERLLGPAVRADVGQTGEEGWHVLADPEGNEFCLLRSRVEPL